GGRGGAGIGDLHCHVVGSEQVGEPVEFVSGGGLVEFAGAHFQCTAQAAFAAAGQDQPVPAGQIGEVLQVVARHALGAAGQVGSGDGPGEPTVAFGAARERE